MLLTTTRELPVRRVLWVVLRPADNSLLEGKIVIVSILWKVIILFFSFALALVQILCIWTV